MQTKSFSVTLDMKKTLPFHPFEVVEGDTGNRLHILLQNDGAALSLDECTVCIVFASSMGFAIQDETSGVSHGETEGSLEIELYPTSYGPGNVSADVQVYSGAAQSVLITSTRFDFRCRRSLVNGEIIRANEAYPPLVAATQDAVSAAAEARAAAAGILSSLGELNVQADWNEQDGDSDAFIRNKPSIPTAPSAIGAAAALHAAAHAIGGDDAVSPASIGAARVLRFTAEFPTDGWIPIDVLSAETTVPACSTQVSIPLFVAAVGNVTGTYAFSFDAENAYWTLAGTQVSLAAYGLTLNGTPVSGDTINVVFAHIAADSVAAVASSSAFSAAVNAGTFVSAVNSIAGSYVFTYDSGEAGYLYNGSAVNPTAYGLTITGTPADGDTITVAYAVVSTDSVLADNDGAPCSVSLADAAFLAAADRTPGTYTFSYDGAAAAWKLNGSEVSLSEYGLTLSSLPGNADTVTVSYTQTAPYTQTVSIEGMAAGMEPTADIQFAANASVGDKLAQKGAWMCVDNGQTGADSITLTCFESLPEAAFTIRLEAVV